jgi:putative two-component system response regulator
MKTNWKTYLTFIVVLSFAPIVRDIVGSAFGPKSHFLSGFEATWHTLLEVFFMAIFTSILAVVHFFTTKKTRKEIQLTQIVSIEALAALAEYRDAETAHHLRRIREFVKILVSSIGSKHPYHGQLKCKSTYLNDIANAAVLHDIGKIAVSDTILLKPDTLTHEEFEKVKQHTIIGSDILAAADRQFMERVGKTSYLKLAQVIARSHHERWEGNGYPDGLKREEIPLSARVTAICDVYDAVTSNRVYKSAWSHEQAVSMIRDDRGLHFDPLLTDLFLQHAQKFEHVKKEYAG